MRILQIGDTHLGIEGGMLGGPRGLTRARDHLTAFDAALGAVERGEVDAVVHTGDVFDRSRPPRSAVIAAADLLVRAARRVPVLVIAGNHDRRGIVRYVPHRVDGLHVIDEPAVVRLGPLRVAALPFVRDAAEWARRAAWLCRGGVDFLVAHQAFDGDRVPGFRFTVGRQGDTIGEQHVPPGLRWIMAGHLHPRQRVELGGCSVVHGGSTERTAFSERDQAKGTVAWEWGRHVSWRFVDGPTRPMVRVDGPGDVEQIVPGAWVLLGDDARDLEAEVRARGGYLRPRSSTRASAARRPDMATSGSPPPGWALPVAR